MVGALNNPDCTNLEETNTNCPSVRIVKIVRSVSHENHIEKDNFNNIALLKLDRSIEYTGIY